ncbi:patatin-like phospholipase family protein [Pedobacter arcticus]|uniref:patatin-like phospholipase family protein n=1 Tax=Pedobacter arcticus TaxID=752140 RepID=UPI0002E67D70|nr:patatin-like phospholipase family protein [Pedobacter arcticus]
MKKHTLFLVLLLFSKFLFAQKVGVVLSGGGAKGLAHIGLLKALEENNIPIDYITGTSMGGVVGAMYAAGYSPEEIEYIALGTDFQDWISGKYDSDYSYFFKKKETNPSFITAKIQIDTGFNFKFRSNLVNDIPLNFALLELLGQASANAKNNFDNLFVPFRCIVSDVLSQTTIPMKKGSLVEAVRGTFTVPLVYRPIKVDDKYVFDGGLYDNFPVDVMKKEFEPDVIIGANVSSKIFNTYPKDIDEKLMNKFLVYLFLSKTDSTAIGENGVYIQPDLSNYSITNFKPVAEIIKQGYDATMAEIEKIKSKVKREAKVADVKTARKAFIAKNPYLTFKNIKISGVSGKRKKYVENVFKSMNKNLNLNEVKLAYYKLLGDDNFETVYPKINYLEAENTYEFELIVQPEKNFKLDFGGAIASRPIGNAFIGLQYNFLRKSSYTLSANFYTGRFHESAQGAFRMDIPKKVPFYLETEITYNHWNYFESSQLFLENVKPTFLEQADSRFIQSIGFASGKNAKTTAFAGFLSTNNKYSPTENFGTGDILDETYFKGFATGLNYKRNGLNRKQYPSKGSSLFIGFSYYDGVETYEPGNILRDDPIYPTLSEKQFTRVWFNFKLVNEKYMRINPKYSLGYLLEGVFSNRPSFANYKGNLIHTTAFYPLQDSKSIFLENFRADKYAAFGIKNVFTAAKNLDFRLEAYVFQPYQKILKVGNQLSALGKPFDDHRFVYSTAAVYHSPVGPISLNVNYYDDNAKRFGVFFHIGYLLYNKRALEL